MRLPNRTPFLTWLCTIALVAAVGCDDDPPTDGDGDADADGDTDADGDGDGDGDADGDSDADDGDADADADADWEVDEHDLSLPGLSAEVVVRVDRWGTQHLTCQTDEDCMMAMGYISASRLFYQMDNGRRWPRGRASALYGGAYISWDQDYRRNFSTHDGEPLEEAIWESMTAEHQGLLQAYSDGVNVWIDDLRNGRNGATLPREYSVDWLPLDDPMVAIYDWEPLDSIAILVSSFSGNSGGHVVELEWPMVDEALPDGMFEDIWMNAWATPIDGSYIGGPGLLGHASGAERPAGPLPRRGLLPRPWHSVAMSAEAFSEARQVNLRMEQGYRWMNVIPGTNNWALSPDFTGGNPIVASDPHSPPNAPSRYLPFVVDATSEGTGTLRYAGAGLLGTPILYQGFNDHMAWGVTTAYIDGVDVYVETLNADATAVIFNGEEVPIIEREVEFEIAGDSPATRTLRWVPHHGPIVAWEPGRFEAVSQRWIGHEALTDVDALLDLMRAESVTEAMETAVGNVAGGGSWVWADDEGHVGWHVAARFPNRAWDTAEHPPWMPLPGDGTCEWDGWVPMESHAREVDPARGFVQSSNNAISDAWADGDPTNDDLPHFQSWYKPGWRFNRVRDLLEETRGAHTLDDTARIQGDTRANPALTIVPALLEAAAEDPARLNPWAASLVDALIDWEYTCPTGLDGPLADSPYSTDPVETRESIGCLAFHAAAVFVGRAALLDEFEEYLPDEDLYSEDVSIPFLHRALSASESLLTGEEIWDDVTTTREVETRNETIRAGLNDAGSFLDLLLDDEPDDWRWGRLHTVTFRSWLSMEELEIGPYASDGAENSVNRGDIDYGNSEMEHIWGPIMRIATELTPDGPVSRLQVPAGVSSDPESRYYNVMSERWLENEGVPLSFTVEDAEARAVEIVTFRP